MPEQRPFRETAVTELKTRIGGDRRPRTDVHSRRMDVLPHKTNVLPHGTNILSRSMNVLSRRNDILPAPS
ncbi:MAG TPA: hypothetical protein PKB10_04960, partial [Tepidisphaeraceae bacterium]|nr:hypothetical protein [Tepidisphaeraceae bacterium]